HGEASSTIARVYARIDKPEDQEGLALSGSLEGPFRSDAHTLPARASFLACRPGESLLAEAVLPDPCLWSPDNPALYRAHLELRCGQQVLEERTIATGLRGLGVSGTDLYRHGRRCVVRAVEWTPPGDFDWTEARAAGASFLVDTPGQRLCEAASEAGVVLLVRLGGSVDQLLAAMSRLSAWPAVSIFLFSQGTDCPEDVNQRFPNLLFGEIGPLESTAAPAPWAHLSVYQLPEKTASVPSILPTGRSVMVARQGGERTDWRRGRRECDDLQRELAGSGDLAGYVVLGENNEKTPL
ncbi:MAG: hypothetical protein CMJ62_08085, partial [Planctomycetaceae bacterium]|nr:hypothetical protein [Planctomycetaceae bacterium]